MCSMHDSWIEFITKRLILSPIRDKRTEGRSRTLSGFMGFSLPVESCDRVKKYIQDINGPVHFEIAFAKAVSLFENANESWPDRYFLHGDRCRYNLYHKALP